MRCPKCGAGLTWNGSFWYCQFCHEEINVEAAKCKTLDKFL
jgi:predicted amidophosphoribosyltransferase